MMSSCHTYARDVCHTCIASHPSVRQGTRKTTHKWLHHVTHVNRHVIQMNQSYHTRVLVMAHIRMSHVKRMDESCHTYGRVMSLVRMCHATHVSHQFKVRSRVIGTGNETLVLVAILCCSVLQCVAVSWSALQCNTVCRNMLRWVTTRSCTSPLVLVAILKCVIHVTHI